MHLKNSSIKNSVGLPIRWGKYTKRQHWWRFYCLIKSTRNEIKMMIWIHLNQHNILQSDGELDIVPIYLFKLHIGICLKENIYNMPIYFKYSRPRENGKLNTLFDVGEGVILLLWFQRIRTSRLSKALRCDEKIRLLFSNCRCF